MRVVLLTAHYPPSDAIAARRASAIVNVLSARGWQIDVLTVQSAEAESAEDLPVGPLRLEDPLQAVSGPAKSVLSRLLWPDLFLPWALKASRAAVQRPDVILASGPPFSVFVAAAALARRFGVPWVADYRDLWTLSGYYRGSACRRWCERRLEARLLATAAGVTSVSAPLVEELANAFGVMGVEIRNGFAPEQFAELPPWEPSAGPLRIVYCGEIYEDKRDPRPLFEALATSGCGPQDVLVEFFGGSVGRVMDYARQAGVEPLIRVRSRVAHRESLALQASADVLLLLLWDDPAEHGVFTGKLFEYIGARRPVLCLGLRSGVAADLIRQAGLGWSPSRSELDGLLSELIRAKRAGGPQAPQVDVEQYAYRGQVDRLAEYLVRLVSRPKPSSAEAIDHD